VLPRLTANSIEVIVTSPPYNQGISYGTYRDTLSDEDYLTQAEGLFTELKRVLAPGGSLFLNLPGSAKNPQIMMRLQLLALDHFVLQNQLVWAKSVAIGARTHGRFRPIRSERFMNRTHELLLHLTHTGTVPLQREAIGVPYTHPSNRTRWRVGPRDRHCAGTVWHVPYENNTGANRISHPAQFPIALVTRCLILHGKPGTVLDPYLGSGTTVCAASEMGWPAIGIEIDPTYAGLAMRRLADTRLALARSQFEEALE
jgi:site-specific DNA-methyltransferase (adenine-specific)